VRTEVRVRVGVRVMGTGDDQAREAEAEGLGVNVGLAEGEGVSDGVALEVAVWVAVALAVALGCAVSDGIGWKGVAVAGRGIAVEPGSAGAVAATISCGPPIDPSASSLGIPEAPSQARGSNDPPASPAAQATAVPISTRPAMARNRATTRQDAILTLPCRAPALDLRRMPRGVPITLIIDLDEGRPHRHGVPQGPSHNHASGAHLQRKHYGGLSTILRSTALDAGSGSRTAGLPSRGMPRACSHGSFGDILYAEEEREMPSVIHFDTVADEPERAIALYQKAFAGRSRRGMGRWSTGGSPPA